MIESNLSLDRKQIVKRQLLLIGSNKKVIWESRKQILVIFIAQNELDSRKNILNLKRNQESLKQMQKSICPLKIIIIIILCNPKKSWIIDDIYIVLEVMRSSKKIFSSQIGSFPSQRKRANIWNNLRREWKMMSASVSFWLAAEGDTFLLFSISGPAGDHPVEVTHTCYP